MLVLLLACFPVPSADAKPAAPPPAPPVPSMGEVVRLHMSQHLASAIITRDSVIHGNVSVAREQLSWMANHEEPEPLMDSGRSWVEALHSAARAGYQGYTVKEYGLAVGREGAACAGCHESLKAPLSQVTSTRPAAPKGHADLSTWAINSMWTGLIANSDAAWSGGAGALAALPTDAAGYAVGMPGPAASAALVTLKEQSGAAKAASDRVARGEAFGQVVAACGSCHAEVGAISPHH